MLCIILIEVFTSFCSGRSARLNIKFYVSCTAAQLITTHTYTSIATSPSQGTTPDNPTLITTQSSSPPLPPPHSYDKKIKIEERKIQANKQKGTHSLTTSGIYLRKSVPRSQYLTTPGGRESPRRWRTCVCPECARWARARRVRGTCCRSWAGGEAAVFHPDCWPDSGCPAWACCAAAYGKAGREGGGKKGGGTGLEKENSVREEHEKEMCGAGGKITAGRGEWRRQNVKMRQEHVKLKQWEERLVGNEGGWKLWREGEIINTVLGHGNQCCLNLLYISLGEKGRWKKENGWTEG